MNLPAIVTSRQITEPQWNTLCNLFPGARLESVALVWDYCVARKLDPMKKPCHIVPMRVKIGGDYQWRDVVMPGIYEYRTTATRTGLYLGHSKPGYGDTSEYLGVSAPEFCEMTIFRWNKEAGQKCEYPVRVYFRECATTAFDKDTRQPYVNDRWTRAPIQMLTKCTEAAGLREAFPDELGGTFTAEEMEGHETEEAAKITTNPRGEEPACADSVAVAAAATKIVEILERDVDEDSRALAVFDANTELSRDQAVFIAAADVAATRVKGAKAAWKKLYSAGHKIAHDPAFNSARR